MAAPRLNLLLLYYLPPAIAANVADHLDALTGLSRHRVTRLTAFGGAPHRLDFSRFDGVIIHYTLIACSDWYLGARTREALRRYRGLKLAFVQDDYRFIDRTVGALADLGVHAVFGLAQPDIVDRVYSPERLPGVRREIVLPGYVPDALTRLRVPPYEARPLDIGYRGRTIGPWLGMLVREKVTIGERVLADAGRYGLRCDISSREEDRLYDRAWITFVSRCKAVLGTESGASVLDFTGEIQRRVEEHSERDPGATFYELYDRYVREHEAPVPLTTISSRCFEAAALRTLMILYEGRYADRLVPWRHYVPLRKDHSNMDEVVSVLRDPERANAIIDQAYREVALAPENNFAALARQMDDVIDDVFRPSMAASGRPYWGLAFEWRFVSAAAEVRHAAQAVAPALVLCSRVVPRPVRRRVKALLRPLWRRLVGAGEAPGAPPADVAPVDHATPASSPRAEQRQIDAGNRDFWNELCGTEVAQVLGIVDSSPEMLARFDRYFFDLYPYLDTWIPFEQLRGKDVLEVGLGYGSVSQRLAEHGARLTALDIAERPVRGVRERLAGMGLPGSAVIGSVLAPPFRDQSFDYVVSIGCYHHTGDLPLALANTARLLRPGGRATLMTYSATSYLRWAKEPARTLRYSLAALLSAPPPLPARKAHDVDMSGRGAPETVLLSKTHFTRLLRQDFRRVQVWRQNAAPLPGMPAVKRTFLLKTLGPLAGLDLYAVVER